MTTRQPVAGTVTGRPRWAVSHELPAGKTGPGAVSVSTCPLALSNSVPQSPGGTWPESGLDPGGATTPRRSTPPVQASRPLSVCRTRSPWAAARPARPRATAPTTVRLTARHGSSTRSGIRMPVPTYPVSAAPVLSASPPR
jgi:hypothetical protein